MEDRTHHQFGRRFSCPNQCLLPFFSSNHPPNQSKFPNPKKTSSKCQRSSFLRPPPPVFYFPHAPELLRPWRRRTQRWVLGARLAAAHVPSRSTAVRSPTHLDVLRHRVRISSNAVSSYVFTHDLTYSFHFIPLICFSSSHLTYCLFFSADLNSFHHFSPAVFSSLISSFQIVSTFLSSSLLISVHLICIISACLNLIAVIFNAVIGIPRTILAVAVIPVSFIVVMFIAMTLIAETVIAVTLNFRSTGV